MVMQVPWMTDRFVRKIDDKCLVTGVGVYRTE